MLPLSLGKNKYRVALLELQLVGIAACDGPLKEIVTHPDDHIERRIARPDVSNSPELFLAGIGMHW